MHLEDEDGRGPPSGVELRTRKSRSQRSDSRDALQSIVDTVRDPLLVLDAEFRVVSANRSFYQVFMTSPQETIDQPLAALGDGQWDLPDLSQLLQKVLIDDKPFDDFVVERIFPGIGERTMHLGAHRLYHDPLTNGGNVPGKVLLEIEDITQRRQATDAAQHSELRYRRLFEAARDGILVLDIETGKITDANPFMTELLGYSRKELVGRELWEIGLFADQEASRVAFLLLQADGYIRYEDLPLESRWGERRDVEFVSNAYPENGKRVIQCNVRDITARKQAEMALQAALLRDRHIAEILQRPLTVQIASDAFPGLTIASLYEAAEDEAEVGGDFFDAFALPGGCVALAIGDASGKGLLSAARTMQVKDVLRAFARETPLSPALIVSRLNDFVCDMRHFGDVGEDTFVGLTLAILDPQTGEGNIVLAGCEPPLIVRSTGKVDTAQVFGIVLGVLPGELYTPVPLLLRAGDHLLMLTDGFTEVRRGPEFLGYDGFTRLVQDVLTRTDDLRAASRMIMDTVRGFADGRLQDDACLLLAGRR